MPTTTLSERLILALAKKAENDVAATQAALARHCGVKAPSVSDWFTGETKVLRAASLVRAAEYLGVRPLWLLEGSGPMTADASPQPPSDAGPTTTPPSLATALPVVLDALGRLNERQWKLVRLCLEGVVGHPEMRDDVAVDALNLLSAASGKRQSSA
jgi:hypothetical protein